MYFSGQLERIKEKFEYVKCIRFVLKYARNKILKLNLFNSYKLRKFYFKPALSSIKDFIFIFVSYIYGLET